MDGDTYSLTHVHNAIDFPKTRNNSVDAVNTASVPCQAVIAVNVVIYQTIGGINARST